MIRHTDQNSTNVTQQCCDSSRLLWFATHIMTRTLTLESLTASTAKAIDQQQTKHIALIHFLRVRSTLTVYSERIDKSFTQLMFTMEIKPVFSCVQSVKRSTLENVLILFNVRKFHHLSWTKKIFGHFSTTTWLRKLRRVMVVRLNLKDSTNGI